MTNTMLNIRIDKGLKDKLQKMADKENRTLSNFILTELMKLVDTSKKKK
jgi:predicted transcriptional regulator